MPNSVIEVRMDSAFFSEELIRLLNQLKAECTISVPFSRYTNLKKIVEESNNWSRVDSTYSTLEID